MDIEMALAEVSAFRSDLVQLEALDMTASYGQDHPQAPQFRLAISSRLPLIVAIAKESKLERSERLTGWNSQLGTSSAVAACDELAGILGGVEKYDAIMGVQGPKLAAASMHPWVWSAAAELWTDGHFRAAIQQAAAAIFDGHMPAALGVTKGDSSCDPSSAFSDREATATSPRFRLPGFQQGTQDWTNAHEGAKFLGMACQKYVRNLTSHSATEQDEDRALEQLAMLSLFARLVDDADVMKVP